MGGLPFLEKRETEMFNGFFIETLLHRKERYEI